MTSKKNNDAGEALFRIPPHFYIHVLDLNTNVTRLVVGPQTFFRQDHERVVFGPEKMIIVPPRHYCIIENPSVKDKDNKVVMDDIGQVRLLHSDQEIRLAQDPFPLYPGEEIKKNVSELNVVPPNSALRLKAILDLEDDTGEKRTAGDEWLFEGPGTYIPKKEVMIEETIRATVIKPNQAIRLCARRDCVDVMGNEHVTGEEWLTQKVGAYLPGAYEKVVDIVNAYVLSETKALHIRSLMAFKDDFGVKRKNGEEWLITMDMTGTHIPHVYEEVMGVVDLISLTHRQYCVIINPVDDKGRPQLGKKKLVKGEKSFFLMPGERLEKDIQDVYVLEDDEALVLKALETFTDEDKERKPGDRWMTYGPTEFVPPVEVEVVVKRRAIPLDVHDGVYVRNIKTGKVRAVTGETYMLSQEEELWEKALPPTVEAVMQKVKDPLHNRSDKSRVIAFRVPQSSAVQIYDYKDKKARVVFGPELVLLGPYEQFTQFTSSGCRSILMALNNSFWNVMSKGFKMIAG